MIHTVHIVSFNIDHDKIANECVDININVDATADRCMCTYISFTMSQSNSRFYRYKKLRDDSLWRSTFQLIEIRASFSSFQVTSELLNHIEISPSEKIRLITSFIFFSRIFVLQRSNVSGFISRQIFQQNTALKGSRRFTYIIISK